MQMHTGHVEYVEPLCGHAKRNLLSSIIIGSVNDGILKQSIEVRWGAIDVWQNIQQLCGAKIHIFNNDTSGYVRSLE